MDIILGYGEVGKAIGKVLTNAKVDFRFADIEVGNAEIGPAYYCMHVCIPYTKYFVDDVTAYIKTFKPELVIIHSTVALGTTNRIKMRLPQVSISHSPVRGVHPNLFTGLLTFEKVVGSPNYENAKQVASYLKSLGIETTIYEDSNTTEAAKLLSTTYYGWNIIFNKEVKKFCDEKGVDYSQAYEDFNTSYNAGYEELDMKWVTRPVLRYQEGPIGGHCVIPNLELLKEDFDIAKVALEFDEKYRPKRKTGE